MSSRAGGSDAANMERYGKIDLHMHLDGSLSAKTILKLAEKDDVMLPADTELGLIPYITAKKDCKDLNEYLRCFDLPLMLLQTAENLRLASSELGRELEALGLQYAEVRFAPQLHGKMGLTQKEAVRAVLSGLKTAMEESNGRIRLRAILCCMRGEGLHEANKETVRVAAEFLGRGVAAVDLAGAEGLYPTGDYEEEFAYARDLGVPFTIHAGEADGPESIWKALEFGAVRIGHGVRAAEDEKLMEELARRGVVLEMCPTSNLQTKAVTCLKEYPLREYLRRGIKVTINSDNMTVSDTWVGEEFALLSREYGLTEEEKEILLQNAEDAVMLSDVPLDTKKIFEGGIKDIRYDVWNESEDIFRDKMMINEEAVAYGTKKKPGTYTIEDYWELPDEQRVELIDGYFYDMAAPTTFHQLMAAELHRQISNYIIDHDGACTPFISPVDVQLDSDEKTMIQPDVVIVCDSDKIIRRNIKGAPDFVLEVISPGTKRRDYVLKLAKYERAKVREYWIVDPYKERVMVYFFEGEVSPIIYPINAEIPVNIYDGKLVLKFERIAGWAKREHIQS